MLLTISFPYFLCLERIVSSEITANSQNETRSRSWKHVIAFAQGSADAGCAESPSEAKYPCIELIMVSISHQGLKSTHFKNPPSSWICNSFSPLILRMALLYKSDGYIELEVRCTDPIWKDFEWCKKWDDKKRLTLLGKAVRNAKCKNHRHTIDVPGKSESRTMAKTQQRAVTVIDCILQDWSNEGI
jgi:hypothetical protein